MRNIIFAGLAGPSLLAIAVATPANAQASRPQVQASDDLQSSDRNDATEIVVTGTQIRGIAPAGVQTIGVSEDQIAALGASSGQDVLKNLPQVSNMFQAAPAPGNNNSIFADRLPTARPNLRNLPNIQLTSVGFTLVLVDGHRMVPIGLQYSGIDSDAVPAALLQRVEVMPDGASAIYGSDAVAGVINFITRDKFDGIRASGHFGLANDYWAYDANITVGKSWSTGGIYASFSRSEHDWILGSDRDFIKIIDWNANSPIYGQPLGTQCVNPNIVIGTKRYPLSAPGGTILPVTTNGGSLTGNAIAGGNRCDTVDAGNTATGSDQSFYPRQKKHNITVGLTQELSDNLKFDVRGFWSRTETLNSGGAYLNTVNVTSANPNYRDVSTAGAGNFNPADVGATQQVMFSWEPIFGNRARRYTTSEWWQVTPQLTWKAGGDWQVRGLVNIGKSRSDSFFDQLDTRAGTGVQARVTAGLINPYNLAASGPGAFTNLVQTAKRYGEFALTNFRVIADGPLAHLPGGDLKVAVGAEYAKTKLTQNLTDANFTFGTPVSYTQSVKSLFGEVQIPIFGEDNAFPGMESLSISGSLRHDRYNDFGNTTNPSIGITYKPVNWIKVRGNWNKSFTAPSPGDQIGRQLVRFQAGIGLNTTFPLPAFSPTNPYAADPTSAILILNQGTIGGVAGDPASLKPQTSTGWSLGLDVEPPFASGLKVGLSYYNLRINDLISGPGTPQVTISQYPQLITCHSTVAGQLGAASNSAAADCLSPLSPAEVAKYIAAGTPASISDSGVFVGGANADYLTGAKKFSYVLDLRSRNLGGVLARGIDFHADFSQPTSWGSIDASFAGNVQLALKLINAGQPVVDGLAYDAARLRWASTVGTTSGPFRAQLTWQHTAGFDLKPGIGNSGGTPGTATTACSGACGQTRVSAYNTFDLFLKYSFAGEDKFTKGLTVTLNVNNLFNQDPPLIMSGSGFTNGFSIGRFVQLGLMKDF